MKRTKPPRNFGQADQPQDSTGTAGFDVQQTPFATDQMYVEIVRLKAVDHRCTLTHAAILKLDERSGGGGILVGLEVFVR